MPPEQTEKIKVLFIEDDQIDQMAIKRFMNQQTPAYQVDIASSIAEAKKKLQSSTYDIVFIDFTLRDGTGFDVFELVSNAPFIVMTGGGSEEIAVEAIKCGAADYLVKDPNQKHLTLLPSIIESTIRSYQSQQKINLLLHALTTVPDSVLITDMENRIIYVNNVFLSTYGYSEKEIVGQSGELLLDTEMSTKDDIYHRRKDGSAFPVLLSRSALKNNEEKEINTVTVVHDITERKKMEEALTESIDKYTTLLDRVENRNIELEKIVKNRF